MTREETKCPWCERPEEYPITREFGGVPVHGINVPNPRNEAQVIGVEIICLDYRKGAN